MNVERYREEQLDEALEQTFPASDSPANTVETGIGPAARPHGSVIDNRQLSRFELTVEGQTAFLTYQRTRDTLTLLHTEVPEDLRGRHFGEELVKAALHAGRSEALRVLVMCPFAQAYVRKHPEAA